ncbi:HAMP domain-containing protein [Embleya sp. NPDC020630]|uniref:HAMP domain-containing protein n=1 Tax=Embleya sp. NPDC020630 TaxID=3363979 RepID=UPI00378CFC1E
MAKASPAQARTAAVRQGRHDEQDLRRLLAALTGVRDGNFRKRLTVSGDGIMSEIAVVFNDMVERNQHLSGELARVRRVVGREGKLTERLDPGPGEGAWATSIDAANALVEDLVRPTVEVGRVLAAVAEGDLSQRMDLRIAEQPLRGEFLRMGRTANGLVDQLSAFADEVTRVAREVGTEGKLGGQARVRGVSGSWKDLTDSVNTMASRLTLQVRDIALVTTAVAKGDLSRTVTVEVAGEMLELKETVNTMVDQLSGFAQEVTRVAREVGTEGRLGGQARVEGVSGTWKDLTDSVNIMAGNLTAQVRDIAQVTKAVAYGDLSQTITVSARGEMAQLAETINAMTGTLRTFASEVTRVAREVGFEGRLGGQAQVPGGAGIWKDLTDSVNTAFFNLTAQVRDIAGVTTAVAQGDLSQKITVDVSGEMLELKNTVNTMVGQLSAFASEVTRVAREVGSEGILGGQAQVSGVAGTWKDLTDSVNVMAGNLTGQVRNIAQVSTAVARGDLSQKITVDVSGEMLELKNTVNTMVDQLSAFASEVTRVAREVGGEGRLGGQARVVPGVAGVWLDLTDSVNFMAGNLTAQVRNIAEVTTAVARGDLSKKIDVDARGEILEVKNTVNTMVDQLSAFADEVTRVAREVGTEGRLGGQAQVLGVAGVWRDLTYSVNSMAGNLTEQVRSLGQVTTAVARGDLSQKITVDARGEILELKNTVNTMVDQLSGFADEVTRVAREVGTEGRLGGQADVKGVSGTWKDLTESVNVMAGNLTGQVRSIADVTTAVATGDLSKKITVDARGEILELKETVNTMVDQLSAFADEVTRVAREVGTEGRLGGQARVRGVSGIWKDLTDNVNVMANNLTSQVRNIAQVATAVADGDLSQKSTVEAKGEMAGLAGTINTMVDTLRAFADEVTRVAREVGTEGILGGQAHVPGVSGTWKDLTDNVNSMADNLTGQVRNIAKVTTAIAGGDLSQKIDVDARGEMLELKTTINTMVDQLSAFAGEVTRVAREVGTEGMLGGQAEVEGVSGTWKQLTENVNELAGNLTRQVRAIAEVATAVTRGDLSLQIAVDASGELDELKDNINQMIYNLRETTRANREQDWLKTNLARISGLMQGRRDLMAVAALIMSELTPVVDAQHGAFFLAELTQEDVVELRLIASYGYQDGGGVPTRFRLGQSLVGQAALEKRSILILDAPPGYIKIASGLGEAAPANVIVLPVLFEDQLLGVLELASFRPFTKVHRNFLEQLNEQIGVTVNTIMANSRTEMLLAESQRLTEELQERSEELQRQQGELRHSNAELEDKAALLARQNRDIEIKNREIEQARQALEERAEQLALSSKYKSEFLANMSHELRTPLNSLLILAKLLADNVEGNLTRKQVEFAETIHGAGSDLLQLINDILDLSKVQAGKMDVRPARIALAQLMDYVEATIRPLTSEKNLEFTVHVSPAVPGILFTDEQRLQQVLRNLLSNAVKFTDSGSVEVLITLTDDIPLTNTELDNAEHAVAFSVIDTGIGIAVDKLKVIFEAFQQADGTTSRRYGGTGLGLSISREIAWLLGGEIHAESMPGRGSTFTLYLPLDSVLVPGDEIGHDRDTELPPAPYRAALPAAAPSTPLLSDAPELPGEGEDEPEDVGEVAPRRVLVVETPQSDGAPLSTALAGLDGQIDLSTAADEGEAVRLLAEAPPACLVVDLRLPDEGAWQVLDAVASRNELQSLPVVVHVPARPTRSESGRLRGYRRRIVLLQRVSTPDALARAVLGATGPVRADHTGPAKPVVEPFEGTFDGERVLIVDDDVRNVFALTSVLEQYGLSVLYAENGREGIEVLQGHDDIAIVLMDVMMPEMDGYATTSAIRRMPQYAGLPIIALTAKAMKGDQEKSIDSGASDYVAKPVDTRHLLGLIRTWLDH